MPTAAFSVSPDGAGSTSKNLLTKILEMGSGYVTGFARAHSNSRGNAFLGDVTPRWSTLRLPSPRCALPTTASRRRGLSKSNQRALSCATTTDRRSPTSVSRMNRGGARRRNYWGGVRERSCQYNAASAPSWRPKCPKRKPRIADLNRRLIPARTEAK
jgi:hypothetical protein